MTNLIFSKLSIHKEKFSLINIENLVILTTMLFIVIFFESVYNKTIIDSVSVTSGIVKAFGSVYPTLIISNVKKLIQ